MDVLGFYKVVRNIITAMGILSGIFFIGCIYYMITTDFSETGITSTRLLLMLVVLMLMLTTSPWYKRLKAEAMECVSKELDRPEQE